MGILYSTTCKCGNRLHWSEGQQPPKCDKCGKTGDWEHRPLGVIIAGDVETAPPIDNAKFLREWWHQILRHYKRYPSYAMLLALPSDNEAIRYVKDYGKELNLITGDGCLVITLTGLGFIRHDLDDRIMPLAVDESIAKGYCRQAAELFKVKFSEFPCLVLFRDIHSSEHILVTLKGLGAEEIALEMRTLFSVVNEAVKQDSDPISALEKYNKQQAFLEKKKAIWSRARSFAGKTFEKMMEAFIKATIRTGQVSV